MEYSENRDDRRAVIEIKIDLFVELFSRAHAHVLDRDVFGAIPRQTNQVTSEVS